MGIMNLDDLALSKHKRDGTRIIGINVCHAGHPTDQTDCTHWHHRPVPSPHLYLYYLCHLYLWVPDHLYRGVRHDQIRLA